MTLQDLIRFLSDELRAGRLTEHRITRTLLLAYEMGLEQGRKEAHAVDAGGR